MKFSEGKCLQALSVKARLVRRGVHVKAAVRRQVVEVVAA